MLKSWVVFSGFGLALAGAAWGGPCCTEFQVAAPVGGRLVVDALEDGLFRVRLGADGAAASESLLNRYGMIEGEWKGPSAFQRSDSGFETAEAKVSVADGVATFRSKVSAANVTVAPKIVGKGFSVRFSLADGERIYGLGDASRANIMRRPGKYDIWISNNTCNIPIPMTLSSAGWGLLLNCTWRNVWDVGESDPGAMVCAAEEGPVDLYLFVGRGYPELLDAYTRLTGRSALLPAFGYGLSFVCNQHIDQFNLISDAARFREYDLPCDVLGLEPPWMEKFYDKSVHKRFDRTKFNFPWWAPTAEFTWPGALRRIGFKLSLWLCCNYDLTRYEEQCVRGEQPKAKARATEGQKGLAWNDTRITGEKDAKKKYPYGISGMEVIEHDIEDDYAEGELPWFWHLHKFVDRGARCFKLDGAYQLSPAKRDWANGRPHGEIKNAYPVIYEKQMGLGYEAYTGRRAMVYSSGGYVGVQRYVATWAGDTGGGVGSLMSILNLGVSGHSNQTCDMDVDNPASVHYGVFQPWSQINNWDSWCQPWLYPPGTTAMIRDYIHLRYRLLPYLYGTAANASRTGWPAMRMLPLAYPENPAYDKVPNTYLLGDSLLVSVFTNRTEIPPGTWYDWRTDKPVTGPCARTEELTASWGGGLYVKAGGIIPTWPKRSHVDKGWNEEVIVEAWPGADGAAELYEDDGDSLDYRKGGYVLTPLKLTVEGTTVRFTVGRRTGSFAGMPATRRIRLRLHAPAGVIERDLGEVGADGAEIALQVDDGSGAGLSPEEIAKLEAEEQMIPVRPGDPEKGVPFWTRVSRVFRRPPSFNLPKVEGATDYEYLVIDATQARHTFVTNTPCALLTPVWAKLPAGPVTVVCEGRDATGRTCGRAGFKRFAKSSHFTGDYPKAPYGYLEAVRRAYDFMASSTNLTAMADHGDVERTSWLYRAYPSKMRSAAVGAMVKYAVRAPKMKARALAIARAEADFLIARSAKEGTPLAGFPLTYSTEKYRDEPEAATKYRGQSMNSYPAEAGVAYLALYRATGDGKYLAAAKAIGERYLVRQQPNGTWYLRELFETGEHVSDNYLVPNAVIDFLLDLHRATDDRRYLDAADRAFAYIENGPLKTWDWEGQFEDVAPSASHKNLTIHMSCDTALFLLARYPGDAKRLAQAREIMRFAEDQFVFWEKPRFDWAPMAPVDRFPAALEQYDCYTPIDSSAAKAIRLYVALYRAERQPMDLLKAKALADSIVTMQRADGSIPTWWETEYAKDPGADWLNCMVASVEALELVAEAEKGE